jgi:hypothetical protein
MTAKKIKEPTEGEQFIIDYLNFNKIKFDREVELNNLKHDDNYSHRRVDFYLKNYRVYIEFNGRWNNTKEDRIRYREKKQVYKKNGLPCIYLYPENLGIIDFVLQRRLVEVLKFNSMKKELFRFQLKRFIDNRGGLFIWLLICLFILSGDFTWEEDSTFIVGLIGVCLYQIYRLIEGIRMFFIKNEVVYNL